MTKNQQVILMFARELLRGRELDAEIRYDSTDAYRFHITAEGRLRVEAGSARAVLYAAYDVLQGKDHGDESPVFSIRGINPCESLARHTPAQIATLIDRMGRWRMNTLIIHSLYGFEEHKGIIERECDRRGIELVHYTYYNLSFCDHIPREFYARTRDGRIKPPVNRLMNSDRLCASQPEGLRLYEQGVKTFLAAHKDFDRILFATSDGYNYCECPDCLDKNAIAQWKPFFDIFYDNAAGRHIEALIYVNRYSIPEDTGRIAKAERIMFDLFHRYRRVPLGGFIPLGKCFKTGEKKTDPRAGNSNPNVYLMDRLLEWRKMFAGKLYLFECLMLQGEYGISEPNTSVYLEDLHNMQRHGIDGVVYEAFEPGIGAYADKLTVIAGHMWHGKKDYRMTSFEKKYLRDLTEGPDPIGHEYWKGWYDEDPQLELATRVYRFRKAYEKSAYIDMMDYLMRHPSRDSFDWMFIGFHASRMLYYNHRKNFARLPEAAQKFLAYEKLWDYMEDTDRPRESVQRALEAFMDCVRGRI